jgi:hypothetical protein
MIATILAILTELFKDLPIINGWFQKSPGQKADQPITDAHNAVKKAEETGDTSDIEKAISG